MTQEPSDAIIRARIEVARQAGLDAWLGVIDAPPKPVMQPNGTWQTPLWNPETGSWDLVDMLDDGFVRVGTTRAAVLARIRYEEKRKARQAGS